VVPRIDGTLYFELKSKTATQLLNWIDQDDQSSSLGQVLVFGDTKTKHAGRESARRVIEETINKLLESDDFLLLQFMNRDLKTLRFDDNVVDVLLADRFEPGHTSWFNFRFIDVFQEANDRFRLTFKGPHGPVSFEVRPAIPPFDEKTFLYKTDIFALYLVEDSRPDGCRERIFEQLERFVGFLLSRAVHTGMRLDTSAIHGEKGTSDGGPISTSRWGDPRQWYQFFSDFEIERSNLCSFRFLDPISWITHGETECRWVEPDQYPRAVTYTNVPWEQEESSGSPDSMSVYTTLGEKEVIMGGTETIRAALDQVAGK